MVDVDVTGPAQFTVILEGTTATPTGIEVVEHGIDDSYVSRYQVYLPPGKGEVTVHLTDVARYRISLTHSPKEKIAA